MPNSNTFSIKPIKELIEKYATGKIVDPFANNNKLATVTNDLDTQYDTDYHMDALDFLKIFDDNSVDTVLYDPPYSPRQVEFLIKCLVILKQVRIKICLFRSPRHYVIGAISAQQIQKQLFIKMNVNIIQSGHQLKRHLKSIKSGMLWRIIVQRREESWYFNDRRKVEND